MNKSIFYISDFFVQHILGGGELNDNELIGMLLAEDFNVQKSQSHLVTINLLQQNIESFFIVSNFCNLSHECRQWLQDNARYIIYEHDHKYVSSRNPAIHRDFKVPQAEIRNYFFYKNAVKILTQSSFHKGIVEENLQLKNILNVSGNLWSLDTLEYLRKLSKEHKSDSCSIMKSGTSHKNTYGTIQYCNSNNLKYELISSPDYFSFLKKLSENKTFIFLPKTPETLSRVVVEARMMGVSIKTNSLVGAAYEPWFEMKGEKLIDYMINKRKEVLQTVINLSSEQKETSNKEVAIISTFHEGEKFLEGFLENMTEQTIFDKCELIIIDSASPGKEREIVYEYTKKYDNIEYIRTEERDGPTTACNAAIKKSNAKYITFGLIDDRKSKECLETLYDEIEKSNVSLVYGDVAQSITANERFEDSKLKILSDHSTYNFSKENMIKCLPGPMPLWKRSIHDECGFFDEDNCNFADDWDMWLRAVDHGHIFGKRYNSYEPYFKQFI